MEESKCPVSIRLDHIWQKADFFAFFSKYSPNKEKLIKKHTILFNNGDELTQLCFIKKGFVKLYQLAENGRETTIYLSGPGNVLGIRALTAQNESASHTAEALTDLVIITISRKSFLSILDQHPEHIVDLAHLFIERLNHTEKRLEGFIVTDATARVAHFLHDSALRFGVKVGSGTLLPLPLTHQRISEFVGSFRETVSVVMKRLEKENAISLKRGKIMIPSMDKLLSIAYPQKS